MHVKFCTMMKQKTCCKNVFEMLRGGGTITKGLIDSYRGEGMQQVKVQVDKKLIASFYINFT